MGDLSKIVITKHGKEMMMERFKCRCDKIEKIIIKAFKSREWPNNELKLKLDVVKKKHGNDDIVYKYFNGYVFIFEVSEKRKVFITAYNPKTI